MKFALHFSALIIAIISLHNVNADVEDVNLAPVEEPAREVEKPKKVEKTPQTKKATKPKKVVKPKPPKRYKLTIKTVPAGATVKITNIKPKYKAGMRLVAGSYNIKVIKDGYETARRTIQIRSKNVVEMVRLTKKAKQQVKTQVTPPSNISKKEEKSLPHYNTPEKNFRKGDDAYNKGNHKAAFGLIYRAATKGYVPAQNALGYMYEHGQGVKKNSKKSFNWYIKAANKGDSSAQWNIGNAHEGKGNISEALVWYRKSAVQGHNLAKRRLKFLDSSKKPISKPKAAYTPIIIPSDTKRRFPKLAECITRSKAMNNQEKNYWYQVLPVMTSPQITELIDILEAENKKLLEIEIKYAKKNSSLNLNNYRRCR